MSDYDPPLVHLPGTCLTPNVVLHRTLNKVDHVKAVVVVIQWADNSFDVDWSQMKVSELCMASIHFDETVRTMLREKE